MFSWIAFKRDCVCTAFFLCPRCMKGRITEFGSLCILTCLSKTGNLRMLKRKFSFSAVQFFVGLGFATTLKAYLVYSETDVLRLCGTCAFTFCNGYRALALKTALHHYACWGNSHKMMRFNGGGLNFFLLLNNFAAF